MTKHRPLSAMQDVPKVGHVDVKRAILSTVNWQVEAGNNSQKGE